MNFSLGSNSRVHKKTQVNTLEGKVIPIQETGENIERFV